MTFLDAKITERQAAEKFAATHWNWPRGVGTWEHRNGRLYFQVVDGIKWYQVVQLGKVGWEVVDAE